MAKVFIDGKEGTTGLKIFERLSLRDDIELLTLPDDERKDRGQRAKMINKSDITILCLPDAAAKESVLLCTNRRVKIIDASTAHRTETGWAYGFPELGSMQKKAIKNGYRVAVPGCHASGFISIVYPLISLGLIKKDYPLCCHSLTGYSGGGKKMIAEYEDEARNNLLNAPRQYGLTQNHKHLKEMKEICSLAAYPIFCPIVAPFYSGMEVTVPLFGNMTQKGVDEIYGILKGFYSGQKFIEVKKLNEKDMLSAGEMSGLDSMKIYVGGNDERILISSVFDNLGKGASGAAIQCLNLMIGANEEKGLKL